MTYEQHLQSAYWRALREQAFARDNWRCVLCDSPEELQCHHRTYVRLGKEELRDCFTLCTPCHDVITDHQRRQRYTTRELPPMQEVGPVAAVTMFGSSYQEIPFETNCEISSDWRRAPLDAQWPTERPAESVDESQKEDYGQAEENGGRPRGNRTSRMDGWSLSLQWSAVHSSRSHQSDVTSCRDDAQEGTQGEAGTRL